MSDPTADLNAAIVGPMRADPGVRTAFAGAPVKVHDGVAPPNAVTPYVVVGPMNVVPEIGEHVHGAETEVTATVWNLADPPGLAGAQAIGAAVQRFLLGLKSLPRFTLKYALPVRLTYMMDSDGRTAKGIVAVRYTTTPL
jgi:hypothetical protein